MWGETAIAASTENLHVGMTESQKKNRRKDQTVILKKEADEYDRE